MLKLEPLQHGQTEDEFSRVDAGRDSGRIVAKLTQNIGAYTQAPTLDCPHGPATAGSRCGAQALPLWFRRSAATSPHTARTPRGGCSSCSTASRSRPSRTPPHSSSPAAAPARLLGEPIKRAKGRERSPQDSSSESH